MTKHYFFAAVFAALIFCGNSLFAQGSGNTVTGVQALNSCTSCSSNVADGYQVLYSCTTCSINTADGYQALYFCTTCNQNTASGFYALQGCSTCYANAAFGYGALTDNNGEGNVAMGWNTLNSNTGSFNTGIGVDALALSNGENYSTAVGAYAMGNTNGSNGYNTAIGCYALDGTSSSATGSDNVAVGYKALYNYTSALFNTASGMEGLYANTTGSSNVANGLAALYNNTIGNSNTAVGTDALTANTTGSENTALGFGANVGSGTLTNSTAIGAYATVSSSNQVVVGSSSVTSIGGYENWTKFSDGRYKKNIVSNVPGLAFINKLTPVTYTLDVAGIESKLEGSASSGGGHGSAADEPAMKQAQQEKAAIVTTGFIAQDVEKAADSVGYSFSGVDKPKDVNSSFYGLRYGDFVPPLVKAVQELSASSNSKDSTISVMQGQLDSVVSRENVLLAEVNELKAMVLARKGLAGASLDQNAPNPFNGSTVIGYSLPHGVSSAQMQITDATGKVLALIPLASGEGKNTLTANVSGHASGTYTYSLIIDGQLAGTKQMIAIR